MSQEVMSQHPLCVLFSGFLFTVMFMHANLLSFGTVTTLPAPDTVSIDNK